MDRPKESDLETTVEFIEWFIKYTQTTEPYAINTINTLQQTLIELPSTMDDLE